MRIAVAAARDGMVYPGHFAHADQYLIYEWDGATMRLVERRENPLSTQPDEDLHGHHMHGVQKYAWLRDNVLRDVGAVIAAGACQTSHIYFTSQGVKMLYVDPIPIDELEDFISRNPDALRKALEEVE